MRVTIIIQKIPKIDNEATERVRIMAAFLPLMSLVMLITKSPMIDPMAEMD